jgi:hypothetical protein
MSVMIITGAHFTGSLVATCPQCESVCAYWEAEDLNEEGHLECHCEEGV